MNKFLSEKYFIGIVIGLFTANIFGSVVIPAHFVVDALNLDITSDVIPNVVFGGGEGASINNV